VAFDFDLTYVDLHTGGRWKGSASELASHARPDVRCFVTRCVQQLLLRPGTSANGNEQQQQTDDDDGVYVTIATFSSQTELIDAVLHKTVRQPSNDLEGQRRSGVSDANRKIAVFGRTRRREGERVHVEEPGKRGQLLSSIRHVQAMTNRMIRPDEVLLVDDDRRNIDIAAKDGYQALLYSYKDSNGNNSTNSLLFSLLRSKFRVV